MIATSKGYMIHVVISENLIKLTLIYGWDDRIPRKYNQNNNNNNNN